VPVYVLYLPGASPRLLPEILSREAIDTALSGLAEIPAQRSNVPADVLANPPTDLRLNSLVNPRRYPLTNPLTNPRFTLSSSTPKESS